ncbi:hypothetical protein PENCOP_c001G02252 [Penicillium coprophilum]|uniref:Uncharacterized protein n=1 Tax=Penicillium coprophilum TaxID=36646 RepID=A0A1V6V6D3_9EURO|nr:hypothetical protein PENCOP_c001G02252 [Penicillium coprophilum]
MAEPQSVKRARANTIGDFHTNTTVQSPDKISQHPSRRDEHGGRRHSRHSGERAKKERNCVIKFDRYSRSIWKLLNVTYCCSMRGGAQYDVSFEVAQDVVDTIQLITKQCGPFTNPRARFNGLSVLRKIGKIITVSSNDTLGHEVQKQFQSDTALVDGMREIIDSLTNDEVRAIRKDESSPKSLWSKLNEL